jgi:hypothetical protein
MVRIMSDKDLLAIIQQRPFVPFRLVTTAGTGYEIRHPEMLMPGRRIAIIGLPDDPDYPSFDRTVTVSLLHVQRLEPIGTPNASGNGAG